eukprot:scaffold581_cov263-Pinguiococcus_pyrenoidosus.AAC.2
MGHPFMLALKLTGRPIHNELHPLTPSPFHNLLFFVCARGFRCPQCRGPRRRYAKMVGDRVGLTLDGGDAPILLFRCAPLTCSADALLRRVLTAPPSGLAP